MSIARDLQYLRDIGERLRRIEMYTQGGRTAFLDSLLIQDAVVRNLEIMGEAAKNLSPAFRHMHADLPWREMGRFRDLAIHVYFKVRLEDVWDIVERELPTLRERLPVLIASLKHPARPGAIDPPNPA